MHRTVDCKADMSNGHQLEEELARDLQQMKVRLQGTPGTVPPSLVQPQPRVAQEWRSRQKRLTAMQTPK
jgi:hypothetical protein